MESICYRNASFENMEFLTVEQSLADIATFIRFIRSQREVGVLPKVILFGSGYGGTIATWTRKKYPHLVDGVNISYYLLSAAHRVKIPGRIVREI